MKKQTISEKDLIQFLDEKVVQYNRPFFIETDPISIPHKFSRKEDIEIAGFFTATISWGQRPVILRNANILMEIMDHSPFEFVLTSSSNEIKQMNKFVHRTFNSTDAKFFVLALRNIYKNHGGLENIFTNSLNNFIPEDQLISPMQNAISEFRKIFLLQKHDSRSEKHISDPMKNSSAKRINMFLRWMVRQDKVGVDFGIWKNISPSLLQIPLDLHVGNVARKLGLLKRTQSDWKAVAELTAKLRTFDDKDPVKYDFALFGLGIFEGFH
ncbi:TIGR02757 family protein [soil metagenome]